MALSAPFHGSHPPILQPLPSPSSHFSLQAAWWPSPLSPDAERDLTQRVWTGDEDARDTLFAANMRLVFFVARRYTVPDAFSFEDLVQWGAMGLWEAIHRFDPTRQTKFSTYAVFWIRQAIGRALDNTATLIRVPVHHRQRLASRDHQADPGPLTPAEACAVRAMSPVQSFDAPLEDDDPDANLYTAYPDPVLSDPLELITAADDAQEQHHLIVQALATLPERTARILAWYTGWPDQEPQSLAAIARRLSLSSERVRQIVQQGLSQLRQMPTLALLDTEGEPE